MPSSGPTTFQNLLGSVAFTIGSAAGLSGSAYLNGQGVIAVEFPGTWTGAPLSFQFSCDPPNAGGTWVNVYDTIGEYQIGSVVIGPGSAYIALPPTLLPSVEWLRLRSGTAAGTIAQNAATVLRLWTRPI